MPWKNVLTEGAKTIGKATVKVAKTAKENHDKNRLAREKKEELLNKLPMKELRKMAKDFGVEISSDFFSEPSREDHIVGLAEAVPMEQIEEYIQKHKLQEEMKILTPKTAQTVNIVHTSQFHMQGSSFSGNVQNYETLFNEFSAKIMEMNIDFNLRKEAMKMVSELRNEFSKQYKDESKIDKICRWFKDNLGTLAVPFIEKILSML